MKNKNLENKILVGLIAVVAAGLISGCIGGEKPEECEDCNYKFDIKWDDGKGILAKIYHCEDGKWDHVAGDGKGQGNFSRNKDPPPALINCTPCSYWFQFEQKEKEGIYTLYHCEDVDGSGSWKKVAEVKAPKVTEQPKEGKECNYKIILSETGETLVHFENNTWVTRGEWKR